MIKHTQTTCWLLPTNCLSVCDHSVGLALKGLKSGQLMIPNYLVLTFKTTSKTTVKYRMKN